METSSYKNKSTPLQKIKILPKEVVDRIAAGEVVQRPASVAKELIENSLDANSSCIEVITSGGGMRLLSIMDDGDGIRPADLNLAAVRFATSKLVTFDDLKSIRTFGFRGEALASASMVSRLSIISRRRLPDNNGSFSTVCAYKQMYRDGRACRPKPMPCAGNVGTVVKVEDLFYNVPSRKRAFEGARKETEEYNRVLAVCQRYAVHRGRIGVSFICRKSGGNNSDLNTQSLSSVKKIASDKFHKPNEPQNATSISSDDEIAAAKDVISHIFGPSVSRELLTLRCSEGDVDAVALAALRTTIDRQQQQQEQPQPQSASSPPSSPLKHDFAYSAFGLITNGSYIPPKSSSQFILFINDRLVSSPSLKRAIENVYADTLSTASATARPFVYLSLELPGPHVDVNVHPTKREVAFLHEEKLCDVMAGEVRNLLGGKEASRTFYAQALLPKGLMLTEGTGLKGDDDKGSGRRESTEGMKEESSDDRNIKKSKRNRDDLTPPSSLRKKTRDPKSLVRTSTAAPSGALEPFLVSTQDTALSQSTTTDESSSFTTNLPPSHAPNCEYSTVDSAPPDLSQPGAFAFLCRCQITSNKPPPPPLPPTTRPKKIIATATELISIIELRNDVTERAHPSLATKLREATYVGSPSRFRSLVQWNTELIMINHYELARELFYQLVLTRFNGAMRVKLGGGGVDVTRLMEEAMRGEDEENKEDEDVERLAVDQAVKCLHGHRKMLNEYFSIEFSTDDEDTDDNPSSSATGMRLISLPLLLENYRPSPHALPLFLLRLATEVDYTGEKRCFECVATELAAFYAELNPNEEDVAKMVRHLIFPAISYLLVPPREFADDGSVVKLALLESLYKVFERC